MGGFFFFFFFKKAWADLCLMYQKMVAQPKPVATLRCERGFGRDDRKSMLQRPSCQVISWLVSLAVKKSLLVQSQPGRRKQHGELQQASSSTFEFMVLVFICKNIPAARMFYHWGLFSRHVTGATSRGQQSFERGSADQQSTCLIRS